MVPITRFSSFSTLSLIHILFKAFGDVDAIPLCVRSKDVEDIVRTVSLLAGSFGGIKMCIRDSRLCGGGGTG